MPPTDPGRAALEAAFAAVSEAPVTVVIGNIDAGKTTLVAALASELASGGAPVAIVDGDVGQSEIGPPTTVGLGRVAAPIARPSDAELIAFQFVGVTSPARDIRGVVQATRRMVDRARREGFGRVLVDTSGLVLGWPGRQLKQRKIEAVDPDLLIFLERADECAPIAEHHAGGSRPRVLRLSAMGRPGSRSQTVRSEYRMRAFDAYLRDAEPVNIARAALELPRGSRWEDVAGALCGFDDADGNTIALGVIEQVSDGAVRVLAPLPHRADVTRVRIGRERKDGTVWGAPASPGRPAGSLG